MIPWNTKEGRIIEVKTSKGIVRVEPPIDIEMLQKMQERFETSELDAYMRIQTFVKEEIDVDDFESFVKVRNYIKSQMAGAGLKEIAKRYEPASKSELTKTISESRTVHRFTDDEAFTLPDDLKGPYSKIPKEAVDVAYKCFENGGKTPADVKNLPEYKWNDLIVTKLLQAWSRFGVVTRVARGTYQLQMPRENLKGILVDKGVDITPEFVREAMWVPTDVAKIWLDKLTDEGILKKHGVNETWNVVSKYAASNVSTIKQEEEKRGFSGGAAQVVQVKMPDSSTFSEFKEEFICKSCNPPHHYIHGYKSGNVKLCGGCYQKIGGKTNNTRGSMEHWSGKNEVKL